VAASSSWFIVKVREEADMPKQDIEQFLAEKQISVVGVSRTKPKFGNQVYEKLKSSGYAIHPVHPEMESMDGDSCVATVRELPADVRALMVIASPNVCAEVLKDVSGTAIRSVWVFPGKGGQDVEAEIERLRSAGVSVIYGMCPFMFLEPVSSIHGVHRFFAKLLGKYPG
jgi:predicted CoA-binding protein